MLNREEIWGVSFFILYWLARKYLAVFSGSHLKPSKYLFNASSLKFATKGSTSYWQHSRRQSHQYLFAESWRPKGSSFDDDMWRESWKKAKAPSDKLKLTPMEKTSEVSQLSTAFNHSFSLWFYYKKSLLKERRGIRV